VKDKEKRDAINRTLNQLSAAARYYALQVKNDHSDVLDTGLSEIHGLLSNCEQLISK
jgi:hypothetical protein